MLRAPVAAPPQPAKVPFPAVGPLGRFSAVMCFVVAIGGALAELVLAWVWLSPDLVERFVAGRIGLAPGTAALDGMTRLAGFGVSMLPLSVLLYALHQAFQLFNAYRVGDTLTLQAPMRLRRIGFAMLGLAALRPITVMLLGLVLTASAPPGQHMLIISFSIDDYMIALFGGLIIAIGHVMLEATRIADEHRQIV